MQKHVKVYLEYYWNPEHIICESCWLPAVDIHHIEKRSKFGSKTKHLQDIIENLIWLCRNCHERAHMQRKPYLTKDELKDIHILNLK